MNSGAGLFAVLIAAFTRKFLPYYHCCIYRCNSFGTFGLFHSKKDRSFKNGNCFGGSCSFKLYRAMTDTVITLKPDAVMDRTAFLIGGFSGITLDKVNFAGGFIVLAFVLALILSYDMNILALGDESAKSLGLNVTRIRFLYLILAAVLAGSAISIAGILGFVGLIVPHIARILVGYDNRVLIPVSALLGSIFTLFCDLLARVIFAPYEIPVGIIMSFLGGPFFIYLLIKGRRGQLYD